MFSKTFLTSVLASMTLARQDFAGYKLMSGGHTEALVEFLSAKGADIWDLDYDVVRVFASPELQEQLGAENFGMVTEDTDIAGKIQAETERLTTATVAGLDDEAGWFTEYHRYEESKQFLKNFVSKHRRLLKYVPSIGKSLEGRDLFAIRLGAGFSKNKPKIYWQGQQHAREWISNITLQYLIVNLVKKYEEGDREIRKLLHKFEIFIVPFVNPDGYEYSWDENRLWRKNRRDNRDGTWGVDLNRNWGYKWASGGASNDTNSDIYHGPAPWSEPETAAVRDLLDKLKPILAIDWHSYTQLLLRPWGDTTDDAEHEEEHETITTAMAETIKNVNGMVYVPQKSIGLYPTSGTAGDYFYSEKYTERSFFGKTRTYQPYGITVELRPSSAALGGFILPPEQIIPTGEENLPAAIQFIQWAGENVLYTETEECTGSWICCRFGRFC